jgi:hypothetical protein
VALFREEMYSNAIYERVGVSHQKQEQDDALATGVFARKRRAVRINLVKPVLKRASFAFTPLRIPTRWPFWLRRVLQP